MPDEIFIVVDESGRAIGKATRAACHANPALIHQAVHVVVCDRNGRLFLQKRSGKKDIQPGKWDTSVGGHMAPGETPQQAAQREMREELGVSPPRLTFAYQYLWRSAVETELVRTYFVEHAGPFQLLSDEIDDGRFWTPAQIEAQLGSGLFTPNFETEYEKFTHWHQEH